MEDYYRLSFKYAKILTDLKEILQTLEPEEEQEEEQDESTDSQPNSQGEEGDLDQAEEQVTLSTCYNHDDSVWVPARGPYRCRLFTRTNSDGQSIIESSLRLHLRNEEQKTVTQASSSQTTIKELDHHEDSISEVDETTSNHAASNAEQDYAKLFQTTIAIRPDCS